MDGPSYSLFHGGDNIRVNTSDIDDEEALERHKSIEKGLNEFLGDDLLDLDETESSIGQSRLFKHDGQHIDQDNRSFTDHNKFYGRVPSNNANGYNKQFTHNNQQQNFNVNSASHEEISRLKNALESKTREVDHIKGLLKVEKNRSDDFEKRFKLSEAEKDRAYMQKQQFHELLVEAKGRSTALEEDISNLKMKIKNLETNNTQLVCDLDSTKTLLADFELKYRIIEKDAQCSRQVDSVLKQENDRHTAQVYMMQQELSSLRGKLEDKELEVINIQARYKELQKSRASIVEEHSGITRQFQRELEENQRSTLNTSQENLHLKKTIQSLERENSELQRTIHQMSLRSDKSKSRVDADQMNSPKQEETLDYFKKGRSSIIGSTPINTNDEINRLKKELDRCTTALNTSKYEIESLEKQLKSKIDENKQLKDDENNALVEMAHYKEEYQRLNGKMCLLDSNLKYGDALEHQKKRLEELQDQIDELQKINDDLNNECAKLRTFNEQVTKDKEDLSKKCTDVLQQNEQLNNQAGSKESEWMCQLNKQTKLLNEAQTECDRLKNSYVEVSDSKNLVMKELFEDKQKIYSLENALKMADLKCSELEEQRIKSLRDGATVGDEKETASKNVSINCVNCIANRTVITKLEAENAELKNSCTNHFKEIDDLKESIKNLNNVVEMKKEYDIMLNELKLQAKEFSELVQTQSTKYTLSAQPSKIVQSCDQSVSTTPDLKYESEASTRREIENEMSKIMSTKMKQLESKSLEQMQEIYRSVELLTGELQKAHSDLKMRHKEVELLKLTLLAERKASSQRLAKVKDELNSNNQSLLSKLLSENEALKKELEERNLIEMSEQESVDVLKKQWHDTETSLIKDIQNLKNVIGEFEVEKSQIIKRLNKKYESAVKRGDNYRDYADAKEQHIISESARIRDEFQSKINKMQTKYLEKLESILKVKEKEHTDKIIKLEEEWRTRLENYDQNCK